MLGLWLLGSAFLNLFGYVNALGWTLDASCAGEIGDKVRASMEAAFQYAEDAAQQLGKSSVNDDVMSVYRHLFLDTEDVRTNKVKGRSLS